MKEEIGMNSYYKSFEFWIPIYRKQFKNGNTKAKRVIKNNLFSNWNLTTKQKEEIWDKIVN